MKKFWVVFNGERGISGTMVYAKDKIEARKQAKWSIGYDVRIIEINELKEN